MSKWEKGEMEAIRFIWGQFLPLTPDGSLLLTLQLDQLIDHSATLTSWARSVCSSATGLTSMQLPAGLDRTRAKTPVATSVEVSCTIISPQRLATYEFPQATGLGLSASDEFSSSLRNTRSQRHGSYQDIRSKPFLKSALWCGMQATRSVSMVTRTRTP